MRHRWTITVALAASVLAFTGCASSEQHKEPSRPFVRTPMERKAERTIFTYLNRETNAFNGSGTYAGHPARYWCEARINVLTRLIDAEGTHRVRVFVRHRRDVQSAFFGDQVMASDGGDPCDE